MVAVAVFTPVEEAQSHLVVPLISMEEKEEEVFFREEWLEEPGFTILSEDLGVAVVLTDTEEVVEAAGGTLVEAVGNIQMTPVVEGEDLITAEQTRKINVVTKQLAMVRLLLHYFRIEV